MFPFRSPMLLALVSLFSGFGNAQLIRVQVLNEARRPVADATVFFAPAGNQGILLTSPQRAKTGDDGTVTVFVGLLWGASGWKTETIAFWARKGNLESSVEYFRPEMRVLSDDYPPTLNLYLRPTETFPARIRLTDERGNPVPKGWVALLARVRKTGEMANWIAFWWSNKNGEVKSTFRLRRSLLEWYGDEVRFVIIAWHPQKGWAWRLCNLAELRNMSLSLSPSQPTTMRFKNCFGEPVAGIKGRLAQIFLPELPYPVPLPPNPFTFTSNKDGVLNIPLPKGIKGSWEWHFETPREVFFRYRSQGNLLSLSPGTHWDIQFHEGTTYVTGTLIDTETGKPLPRCPLLIEFHTGAIFSAVGTYWHRTSTDQQGRFEVKVYAPLSKRPLTGASLALHLPDGQRFVLKMPEQTKHLEGCWRISFPPLAVRPLTGQLIVKADFLVKEYTVPKELERAARRSQMEFKEMLKQAKVFIAARALREEQQPKSMFVEAINCKGQKVKLEFICHQDSVGAAVVTPPSQPASLRLGDGEWMVIAFIALPRRYYEPNLPLGAHFFALLESPRFLKPDKNIQKVQLPPNQVCEVSLSAIVSGNFSMFRPKALEPELLKK